MKKMFGYTIDPSLNILDEIHQRNYGAESGFFVTDELKPSKCLEAHSCNKKPLNQAKSTIIYCTKFAKEIMDC